MKYLPQGLQYFFHYCIIVYRTIAVSLRLLLRYFASGRDIMICGICGQRMKAGTFRVSIHGIGSIKSYTYPMVSWYEGDNLVCETDRHITTGFYCPRCNIMMGVFLGPKIVGFTEEFNQDLDDNIDSLPKKNCPECGTSVDVDYPRCPECGYVF